ncbi:MAG: hypothetical protein RLZZ353_1361 [Actinomycetota bacterium]
MSVDGLLERDRAGGQAVRVGRGGGQPAVGRLEVHPGQHGAGVLAGGCRAADLRDQARERVGLDAALDRGLRQRRRVREVLGGDAADAELRPAALDADPVAVVGERDVALGQPGDELGQEARGQQGPAGLGDAGVDADLGRDLEVGGAHHQPAVGRLEQHAGQRRQLRATAGDTGRPGDGVGQVLARDRELHGCLPLGASTVRGACRPSSPAVTKYGVSRSPVRRRRRPCGNRGRRPSSQVRATSAMRTDRGWRARPSPAGRLRRRSSTAVPVATPVVRRSSPVRTQAVAALTGGPATAR